MDLAKLKTVNKELENQFVLQVEEFTAFIDYKVGKKDDIYIIHTKVPTELEGRGVGHKLVRESLAIIESANQKVVPLCPFVRAYMKKHQADYEHLLAEGRNL